MLGFWPGPGQVVVEAGELQRPAQLGLYHARPDATPAYHEALVDQVLHRPSHGGTREAEGRGEVDLVLEQRPRGKRAGADCIL